MEIWTKSMIKKMFNLYFMCKIQIGTLFKSTSTVLQPQ